MTPTSAPPNLTLPVKVGLHYLRRDGQTTQATSPRGPYTGTTHLVCVATNGDTESHDMTHVFAGTGRVSSLSNNGADSPLDLVADCDSKRAAEPREPQDFAEVLVAIAKGEQLQVRAFFYASGVDPWHDRTHRAVLEMILQSKMKPSDFRVKPKTIRIGEREVPAPVRQALPSRSEYWMVSFEQAVIGKGIARCVWDDSEIDKRRLSFGLVHLSAENAKVHFNAILALLALPPL